MNTAKKIQQSYAVEAGITHKSTVYSYKDPGNFDIHDKSIRTTDDYHEKLLLKFFERSLTRDIYSLVNTRYSSSDEIFTESRWQKLSWCEQGNVIVIRTWSRVGFWRIIFLNFGNSRHRLTAFFKEQFRIYPTWWSYECEMLAWKIWLCHVQPSHLGSKSTVRSKHVVYVWADALSTILLPLVAMVRMSGNLIVLGKMMETTKLSTWLVGWYLSLPPILLANHPYGSLICHCLHVLLPTVGSSWKAVVMSKSKGNVIYSEMLVERFVLIHLLLMRSLPVGSDGTFTPAYVARINTSWLMTLGTSSTVQLPWLTRLSRWSSSPCWERWCWFG